MTHEELCKLVDALALQHAGWKTEDQQKLMWAGRKTIEDHAKTIWRKNEIDALQRRLQELQCEDLKYEQLRETNV